MDFYSFNPPAQRDPSLKYRIVNEGIQAWRKDGIFGKFKMVTCYRFDEHDIVPWELNGYGAGIIHARTQSNYDNQLFVETAEKFVAALSEITGNSYPDFEFRNGC